MGLLKLKVITSKRALLVAFLYPDIDAVFAKIFPTL